MGSKGTVKKRAPNEEWLDWPEPDGAPYCKIHETRHFHPFLGGEPFTMAQAIEKAQNHASRASESVSQE